METGLSAAVFVMMFGSVLAQVFFRYVIGRPLTWPLELSVYCYVYLVYLGSVMAARRGSHVAFDMLLDRLPGRARLAISSAVNLVMSTAFIVLVPSSIGYMRALGGVKASSLPVTWGVVLVVFPVCMSAMAIIMAARALSGFRNFLKGEGA